MYYVVGLGNKGASYEKTRHNAGRIAAARFVDVHGGSFVSSSKYAGLVSEGSVGKTKVLTLLPETYMNESGGSVKKLVTKKEDAQRLIVLYDDIDLSLGTIRISYDRGSGGHNGLQSVIKAVKTKEFSRIRIGICRAIFGKAKKPESGQGVLNHVMGEFMKSEENTLDEVCARVGEAIEHIIEKGPQSAMNAYNGVK